MSMNIQVIEDGDALEVRAESGEREARDAVQMALDAAFARVSLHLDLDNPRYAVAGGVTSGRIEGLGGHLAAAGEAARQALKRAGHEVS